MVSPPVLAIFKEGRQIRVELDASARAIGAMLEQKNENTGQWHPVAYFSRIMPPKYKNEIAYDLELTGLVKTLEHFREYLYGAPRFTVYTDHLALIHIAKTTQQPSRRLARLVSKVQEYEFDIRHKQGSANIVPDTLSRIIKDPETRDVDEGFVNYVSDSSSDSDSETSSSSGDSVSVSEISTTDRSRYSDTGFETNQPDSESVKSHSDGEDTLPSKLASKDLKKYQSNDKFCKRIQKTLTLKSHQGKNARKIYKMNDLGILERKSKSKLKEKWLPIVPDPLKSTVLTAFHENQYGGGHFGKEKTYEKIKNFYFWKNLYTDVLEHVKSCHVCQLNKAKPGKGHGLLKPIPVEDGRLFSHIEMDFMGEIQGHRRKKYILVLTCRTSKYAYAEATKKADADTVINVLKEFINIFSCPRKISSDNGTHFKNKKVKQFLDQCGIENTTSTSYAPQSQGSDLIRPFVGA